MSFDFSPRRSMTAASGSPSVARTMFSLSRRTSCLTAKVDSRCHIFGRRCGSPAVEPAFGVLVGAGVHADRQLVRRGRQVDPLHAQRQRPARLALQQHRAGAVGQHPAQEVFLEGQLGPGLERLELVLELGLEVLEPRITAEASSEPVATARRASPARTDSQACFSAVVPARQMPAQATTSSRGQPSSPCTITAWLGISWSGSEVPVTRQSTGPMSSPSAADGRRR
jgi:hypothetical protein